MENKEKNSYISVVELAKLLGISRVAVFKRIQKGQIPAEKIGHSYVISRENADAIVQEVSPEALSSNQKDVISQAVARTVKEYGETLRLLGKE